MEGLEVYAMDQTVALPCTPILKFFVTVDMGRRVIDSDGTTRCDAMRTDSEVLPDAMRCEPILKFFLPAAIRRDANRFVGSLRFNAMRSLSLTRI